MTSGTNKLAPEDEAWFSVTLGMLNKALAERAAIEARITRHKRFAARLDRQKEALELTLQIYRAQPVQENEVECSLLSAA
jgi:hypothetical protein